MKVMIAHDGSGHADAAIDDLRRAGLPRDTDALVVSVADFSSGRPAVSEFNLISAASRRIETILESIRTFEVNMLHETQRSTARAVAHLRDQFPEWNVSSRISTGRPAEELLREACEWNADLIVAGSHGRSAMGRFFLGSVSKSLAEKAPSSVRVARSGDEESESGPIEVILGVKAPPEAERLVDVVGRRVWPVGTRIRLVAIDDGVSADRVSAFYPDGKKVYETIAERLAHVCLDVSVQLESGDPKDVLLRAADAFSVDAIFVPPGNINGLDETASGLVTNAKCTVEIVR